MIFILIPIILIIYLFVICSDYGFDDEFAFRKRTIGGNEPKTIIKYDQITKRRKYSYDITPSKCTIHIGQLKLLISELQFMNRIDPVTLFVYAGSGPGNHMPLLSMRYPAVKFLLIDPQPHLLFYPGGKTHFEYPDEYCYLIYGGKKSDKMINILTKSEFGWTTQRISAKDPAIAEHNMKFAENMVADPKSILRFILKESKYKYYILEDLFTDALAASLGTLKVPIAFCCDIRTNILGDVNSKKVSDAGRKLGFGGGSGKSDQSPTDLDLLWNLAQQYIWISKMKPMASLLKFRCPFMEPNDRQSVAEWSDKPMFAGTFAEAKKIGIDFIGDYKQGKLQYFDGDIYLQAYAPSGSAESRLLVTNSELKYYGIAEYEEKLFWYNSEERCRFRPDYKSDFDFTIGIDGCADCAIMLHTLKECKFTCSPAEIIKTLKRNFKENTKHGLLRG